MNFYERDDQMNLSNLFSNQIARVVWDMRPFNNPQNWDVDSPD